DAEVVRLRGNLLPLIKLADVIGIDQTYTNPEDGLEKSERRKNIADRRSKKQNLLSKNSPPEEDDHNSQSSGSTLRSPHDRRYHADSALNIVVVSTGARKYGLVVDSLHDSEEIVVKPLGRHLKHCRGYAGATIMGDGRVALILDVAGLSKMAALNYVEGVETTIEDEHDRLQTGKDVQSLLMFRNAEDEQFAVPLSLVSRIETVNRDAIEEVGGKKVMQYREMSLPLLSIEDVAAVKPVADTERLLVIVFTIAGREMGLLATSPVDAAEVAAAFDETTLKQTGIMGSAIISGCTTQMVDIFELVQTMHPEWFEEREVVQTEYGEASTILYAEDSNFFRTQVQGFMENEGYNVVTAEDGEIAWELICERGEEIDLVVTDIEMPNMNGFELSKKIKQDERFMHLPIIAMTTLAGEEDIAKGQEVGIDDYQIKLDKEKLLESIHDYLSK
nr:chemotaxis protein CheW [Desulfobacterales bacterium]